MSQIITKLLQSENNLAFYEFVILTIGQVINWKMTELVIE